MCNRKWFFNFRIYYQSEVQNQYSQNQSNMFLGLAIASTITSVVLTLTVIFLRKRIKLVIVLFKEAGKAVSSMPLILFEPITVCNSPTIYSSFRFHSPAKLTNFFFFFSRIDFYCIVVGHCTLDVFYVVDWKLWKINHTK